MNDKRIYGLDIIRAFAILLVLYSHGRQLLPEHTWTYYDYSWIDGVDLFFVLSGFLIGGILINLINTTEFNKSDLFNFWIRRWFRTLPNYFLVLSLLIIPFLVQGYISFYTYFNYLTFTQNLCTPHPVFFGEAWSIAVEEWFYFAVPLLIFLSIRLTSIPRKNIILFWILFVIVSITCVRMYRIITLNIDTFEQWDLYLRKQVITRLDTIMVGFLGAYISYYYTSITISKGTRYLLFFAGLFLIVASNGILEMTFQFNYSKLYINFFYFSTTSLGSLMLFPLLVTIKTGKGVAYKIITFISIISYSLYLVHRSIVQANVIPKLAAILPFKSPMLEFISFWAISFLLAYLLYSNFEKRTTKLRDYCTYK